MIDHQTRTSSSLEILLFMEVSHVLDGQVSVLSSHRVDMHQQVCTYARIMSDRGELPANLAQGD